jgi:glycosyltransferase involved in cell wall biosynthesis
MINLHLYPSPFTHESRIFRETETLAVAGLFSGICLVGIAADGLPARQQLDTSRTIVRLPRPGFKRLPGTLGKLLATVHWSLQVYRTWASESVSCINCHSLPVLPLGVLLKWRTGSKLVYDTHELETETNGVRGLRRLLSKAVERLLLPAVDATIVVGNSIADWYAHTYGMERPAVVLNCPRLTTVPRSARLRNALGLGPADRVFLYQGALAPGRGLEVLLAAFERVGDAAFLVVLGYGPLAEKIADVARRRRNVRYHPAVPPADLLEYTSGADFGVSIIEDTCLSYRLCLPNKLFEYLMAGVPVIVSNLPELTAVVQDCGIGQVAEEQTVEAVERAIRAALTLDASVLRANIDRARSRYSWEAQEHTLIRVHSRLLEPPLVECA